GQTKRPGFTRLEWTSSFAWPAEVAAEPAVAIRVAGRVGTRVSRLLSVLFLHPRRLVVAGAGRFRGAPPWHALVAPSSRLQHRPQRAGLSGNRFLAAGTPARQCRCRRHADQRRAVLLYEVPGHSLEFNRPR